MTDLLQWFSTVKVFNVQEGQDETHRQTNKKNRERREKYYHIDVRYIRHRICETYYLRT